LKENYPNKNFGESEYIEVGKRSDAGRYRDLILFEQSPLNKSDPIGKATLSLFWYYPEGQKTSNDTVLDIYRPVKWCEDHVTWEEKESISEVITMPPNNNRFKII
jgi:hypothetical protein